MINNIKKSIAIFTFFFLAIQTVNAAEPAPGQPLGACKSGVLTISCPGKQDCWDITPFKTAKILSASSDNMCLPQISFDPCIKYDGGTCENGSGGFDQCVTLSAVKKPALIGMACLGKNLVPQEKTSIDIDCSTCNIYQQCVYVIPNNTDVWPRKRCINIDALPPEVITNDGTCQTNAACKTDEMCIYNTFEPQKYGFSCVKKTFITDSSSCPQASKNELDSVKAGISCGTPDEKKFCMYAIRGYAGPKNFTPGYRCVDAEKIAGGINSPSPEVCKTDADCSAKTPGEPYCITNPATKKNQCFGQGAIFTDMKTVSSATPKCGTGTDVADCKCPAAEIPKCAPEPNTNNSTCATYIGDGKKSGLFACIKTGNLGTGGASQNLQVIYAKQTYEALAPKLQVDIPGLSFTQNITATDGPGGIKRFSIPYLSLYINAVYKYAIGLGVLISIIFIMYGGFRWMTAFGNGKSVSEARSLIGNAVLGLALLLGAYSILYLINPDLTKLESIKILTPKQMIFESELDLGGDSSISSPSSGGTGELPPNYTPSKDVYCPKSGGRTAIPQIVSSLRNRVVYRWGGKIGSQNITYGIKGDLNKELVAKDPSYAAILKSCPQGLLCFDCSGLVSYIEGCAGIKISGGSDEITGSVLFNTKTNPIDYINATVNGYKLQPGDIFGWRTEDEKVYANSLNIKGVPGHVMLYVGTVDGKPNQIVHSTGQWKGVNGYLPGLNAMIMDFNEANMTKAMPGSSKNKIWYYRIKKALP